MIRRILRRLFGPTEADIRRFEATFPGKCMLCSCYRYGRNAGHTAEPTPPHDCPEAR